MKSNKAQLTVATVIIATIIGVQIQLIADSGEVMYSKVFIRVLLSVCCYTFFQAVIAKPREELYPIRRSIVIGLIGSASFLCASALLDGYFDYWTQKELGVLNQTEFISFWTNTLAMRVVVLLPILSFAFVVSYNCFRLVFQFFRSISGYPRSNRCTGEGDEQ